MNDANDFKNQWANTRKTANGYTRIDISHPLEWYIGYGDSFQLSLMVISEHKSGILKSSQSIDVNQHQRQSDGRWCMVLNLLTKEQEDVFVDMCFNILSFSQAGRDEEEAFQLLQRRYIQWDKLLQHGYKSLLSKEEQRGLLGELLFLKKRLVGHPEKKYEQICGWYGPDCEHQDFMYADTWYEIKTVMESAKTITISSLEQLSPRGVGKLIINKLCNSTSQSDGVFTLNSVVDDVESLCKDSVDATVLLSNKLASAGFIYCEEYGECVYRFVDVSCYLVDNDFPRLIASVLPAPIVSVKYSLSIAAIENWKSPR